jgi:hypothetical protein
MLFRDMVCLTVALTFGVNDANVVSMAPEIHRRCIKV